MNKLNPPKTGGQGPIFSSDELNLIPQEMEAKLKDQTIQRQAANL